MFIYIASGIAIAVVIGLIISAMTKKKKAEADERAATVSGANVTTNTPREADAARAPRGGP